MIEMENDKLNFINMTVDYGIDWLKAADQALTPAIFDKAMDNAAKNFAEAINTLPDCADKAMYRMILSTQLVTMDLIKNHLIKQW